MITSADGSTKIPIYLHVQLLLQEHWIIGDPYDKMEKWRQRMMNLSNEYDSRQILVASSIWNGVWQVVITWQKQLNVVRCMKSIIRMKEVFIIPMSRTWRIPTLAELEIYGCNTRSFTCNRLICLIKGRQYWSARKYWCYYFGAKVQLQI